MNTQSVFDTSISSYNIGNEIIMDAVNVQLNSLFPNDFIVRLPIEDIGTKARMYNGCSQHTFVGGTNVLNGDMRHYRQWDLSLHNAWMLKNVVLLGCGWFQYETNKPASYTKWALNRVLAKNVIHSVRDNYTLSKCSELNLPGVEFINTGCPTLWSLTPQHLTSIPKQKSRSVIFTITDYHHNPQRDTLLVKAIKECYEGNIYFFPQGMNDVAYLSEIDALQGITIVSPRLKEYDRLLKSGVDYVGTRLHAGIRALQQGCRSFIIGIDNRAIEMKRDFGLPVLPQDNIANLSEWIQQDYDLSLDIPWEAIQIWKSQFKH
jgi:hypothetical protein